MWGNELAFGMKEKVAILDMESGTILQRFASHSSEITALEMDHERLYTADATGEATFARRNKWVSEKEKKSKPEGKEGRKEGKEEERKEEERKEDITMRHHSRAVIGMKLTNVKIGSEIKRIVVTIGMDSKLVAADSSTGKVLYSIVLPFTPLCLDVCHDGTYSSGGRGEVRAMQASSSCSSSSSSSSNSSTFSSKPAEEELDDSEEEEGSEEPTYQWETDMLSMGKYIAIGFSNGMVSFLKVT